MKLSAALLAAMLVLPSFAQAAQIVDRAEPPATPAGGAPEAGIGVAGAVGIGIAVAVIVAIAAGDDDDATGTTTTTTTTTTSSQ